MYRRYNKYTSPNNPINSDPQSTPITSKDVFNERKINLDNAYQMAVSLVQKESHNTWNKKALAWCLIDLVKRESKVTQSERLDNYIEQLEWLYEQMFECNEVDEILDKQFKYTLNLSNPLIAKINEAKTNSLSGDHRAAANIYYNILKEQPHNIEVQTSFAWTLYRLAQETIKNKPIKIENIKRYFFEYFKLNVERPSKLHHCFLFISLRCIENESISLINNINFSDFCVRWDFSNLDSSDFLPNKYRVNDEERVSNPVAINVFRYFLQNAIFHKNIEALRGQLAFIEKSVNRIKSDTIWLEYDLAKAYMFLGEKDLALAKILPILKKKPNEYWLWELLGDLYYHQDQEIAISCYCKALICQKDINFIAKIKVKLSQYFIEKQQYNLAKTELNEVIKYKELQSQVIPTNVLELINSTWFIETSAEKDNKELYKKLSRRSEEILYQNLPWINANIGDVYKSPNEKISRKIFITEGVNKIPLEITIPENKINLSKKTIGMPIHIKGEWIDDKFQIYCIEKRVEGNVWDMLFHSIALVDHINSEKQLAHCLVSETIDTTVPIKDIEFQFDEFTFVDVALSKHYTKDGKLKYKAHKITETTDKNEKLLRNINEKVTVSNGMGFSEPSSAFISPDLIQFYNINNGDKVKAISIRNYNKKKSTWGWKITKILEIEKNPYSDEYDYY